MVKPLRQTGLHYRTLGTKITGRWNEPWYQLGQKPISDLRLYCQDLIVRESPQGDKQEGKRHFCQYVLVQSVGKGQVERWHLKRASECCSKHEVVAEARETVPISGVSRCLCFRDRGQPGWMGSSLCWAITLLYPEAQQRPLVTWEMGERTVRYLRIWRRKISWESPCKSGAGKTRELRCTSFVLCVLRLLLQCLSAADAFP